MIFQSVTSLSLDCFTRNGENFYASSRELKCSCRSFDDQTLGKEYLSEIIKSNVAIESPLNNPKVTHIVLRDCRKLDVILDLSEFDKNVFQVTDVSFITVPVLSIEFQEAVQTSLKLVVENSVTTTITGTFEDYGNVEMYFRQVGVANSENSEVVFQNFFSRSRIHLLNFIDIGKIIVDNSNIQSIDELDVNGYSRKCFQINAEQVRQEVSCTKDLFYINNRPEPLVSGRLTDNPAFIVPIVLLCAVIIIILVVVFFIKIKKVRKTRSMLAGDNWFLRQSPSPSYTSGSQLHPAGVTRTSPPSSPSLTTDPIKTSVMQPVSVTVPSSSRGPHKVSQGTTKAQVLLPSTGAGAKVPYDRQISRVRSLSVFSSESHIHRDQDMEDFNDDSISLDFDIQESDEDKDPR